MSENNKKSSAAERLAEEQLYEQVARELANGKRRNGLWTKALANSDGLKDKAEALYIKYRVQSIKDKDELQISVDIAVEAKKCAKSEGVSDQVKTERQASRGYSQKALREFIFAAIIILTSFAVVAIASSIFAPAHETAGFFYNLGNFFGGLFDSRDINVNKLLVWVFTILPYLVVRFTRQAFTIKEKATSVIENKTGGIGTTEKGFLGKPKLNHSTNKKIGIEYAGFWKRVIASIIDGIVLMIGGFVIGIVFAVIMVVGYTDDQVISQGLVNIWGGLLGWIYFAAMESSTKQATLGKIALGIKVTDMDGNQIGFGKATGRYFGKIISAIILCIGFIMVAFTQKKQGLHDIMVGCLVVNK